MAYTVQSYTAYHCMNKLQITFSLFDIWSLYSVATIKTATVNILYTSPHIHVDEFLYSMSGIDLHSHQRCTSS